MKRANRYPPRIPIAPRRAWPALAALALLAGCSAIDGATARLSNLGGLVTPYRMEILQGNVVVREQVQALQPGMTREQVQAILGTPLLASIFHADRWDYVFTLQRQGQPPQRRAVSVFFEGDRLLRVEADEDLPTEEAFVASLQAQRAAGKPVALEATPEQLQAFEAKVKPAAGGPSSPAAEALPARNYPPLEAQ
jgi:outer membrane protein assembly factor BamE